MKVRIDGHEVEGSIEDILHLIGASRTVTRRPYPAPPPYPPYPHPAPWYKKPSKDPFLVGRRICERCRQTGGPCMCVQPEDSVWC